MFKVNHTQTNKPPGKIVPISREQEGQKTMTSQMPTENSCQNIYEHFTRTSMIVDSCKQI